MPVRTYLTRSVQAVDYIEAHPKDLVLTCFVSDSYASQALQDEYEMTARKLKTHIDRHSITVVRVDVTGHEANSAMKHTLEALGVGLSASALGGEPLCLCAMLLKWSLPSIRSRSPGLS